MYNYRPQYQYPQQNYVPQNNGIVWVQGIEGAKAYPVASGASVMLMDSERNTFYIKSSDQSGMPSPLRVFDYTERKEEKADMTSYVTHDELEKRIAELTRKQKKEAKHE